MVFIQINPKNTHLSKHIDNLQSTSAPQNKLGADGGAKLI
jgi:hypothetical protein